MNKILTALSIIFFTAFTGQAHAQTPTTAPASPDKSAISDKLNQEINNLKEKIASRVSELNLVEKRGMIGTVTEVSGNQVTITDLSGKTRFINVDEITKFSSPATKTFGISDLTKGTRISALGLYNKQSKRLLARFVRTSVDPVYVSGSVGTMDKKNFQLTILSDNQKETKIDNQTTTKILTYTKDGGFTKLTFPKLVAGERAFVVGYPDKTDKSLIVADRIIIVPFLPKNNNVVIPEQQVPLTPTTLPARR